jgi:hypothetical protein
VAWRGDEGGGESEGDKGGHDDGANQEGEIVNVFFSFHLKRRYGVFHPTLFHDVVSRVSKIC